MRRITLFTPLLEEKYILFLESLKKLDGIVIFNTFEPNNHSLTDYLVISKSAEDHFSYKDTKISNISWLHPLKYENLPLLFVNLCFFYS